MKGLHWHNLLDMRHTRWCSWNELNQFVSQHKILVILKTSFVHLTLLLLNVSLKVDKHIRKLDADLARFEADLRDKSQCKPGSEEKQESGKKSSVYNMCKPDIAISISFSLSACIISWLSMSVCPSIDIPIFVYFLTYG